MYVCLGVTCHLHFWQKEPGSLTYHCGNTCVERTPNKSRHTKLTLEKKIFPPLLPGFELATFRSRVRCCNQQAVPTLPTSCPDSTNKLSRLYQQAVPTLPTSYPDSLNWPVPLGTEIGVDRFESNKRTWTCPGCVRRWGYGRLLPLSSWYCTRPGWDKAQRHVTDCWLSLQSPDLGWNVIRKHTQGWTERFLLRKKIWNTVDCQRSVRKQQQQQQKDLKQTRD